MTLETSEQSKPSNTSAMQQNRKKSSAYSPDSPPNKRDHTIKKATSVVPNNTVVKIPPSQESPCPNCSLMFSRQLPLPFFMIQSSSSQHARCFPGIIYRRSFPALLSCFQPFSQAVSDTLLSGVFPSKNILPCKSFSPPPFPGSISKHTHLFDAAAWRKKANARQLQHPRETK